MQPPSTLGSYLAALRRPCLDALTDGELLARFASDRLRGETGAVESGEAEDAFGELVRRHGGMVHGVARRVLGGDADADDCVQAAFVVLARRAARFVGRATVGDFLHGVALRVALKARSRTARRRFVEARAARPESVNAQAGDDLAAVVDRAVQRLPRKLRDAVVLCDLEGQPRKLAAERLGVPEGTLSSRLTAAHRKLAGMLSPPAVALATLGSANIPDALAAAVVKTATGPAGAVPFGVMSLVSEVSTAMLVTKLKPVLLGIAFLGVTATGAGVLQLAGGQEPKAPPDKVDPATPPKADPPAAGVRVTGPGSIDLSEAGLTDAERAEVRKQRDGLVQKERDVFEYFQQAEGEARFGDMWTVKRQSVNGRPVAATDGVRLVRLTFANQKRDNTGPTGTMDVTVTSEVRRFGREPAEDSELLTCILNPHRTPKELTLFTRPKLMFNVPPPVAAGAGLGGGGGGAIGVAVAFPAAVDVEIPGVPGGTVTVGAPVMTQYIYELKGNTLRLATYKNWGEADRPHGFVVGDQPKNGADLWVIELEREKQGE